MESTGHLQILLRDQHSVLPVRRAELHLEVRHLVAQWKSRRRNADEEKRIDLRVLSGGSESQIRSDCVDVGVDLTDYYQSIEWTILSAVSDDSLQKRWS